MGLRYPQPNNEDEFEELCLRFYRKHWSNENLKLYGKRGERQNGIDIFDPLCIKPIRAVQCKHHEPTKALTPSEIEKEVAKAEQSGLGIEHFVIATTAKRSRKAHDTVVKLNQRSPKQFSVDIHFWDDICRNASEMGKALAELIIYGEVILAGAARTTQVSAIGVTIGSSMEPSNVDDAQFTAIDTLINERRLDAARHELDKLINHGNASTREVDPKNWAP